MSKRRVGLWLAVVLGLTLIIWIMYSPILTLKFTGRDSLNHISSAIERTLDYNRFFTEQLAYQDPWYRPISALSYGINYSVSGLNPTGYHFTDIFIHWVAALGVLVLGYQVTHRLWAAGVGALLFALNPLLPPTVLNIAQRHDTLMTLGIVWTIALLYAAFHTVGLNRAMAFLGSWLAFLIAVGAKESGLVALPLVLWMSWRHRQTLSHRYSILLTSLPFVLIALAYLVMRQIVLQKLVSPFNGNWNFRLLILYLQESIMPLMNYKSEIGIGWLAFAIAIGSIVLLCLANLQDIEFQTWGVLFGMWIGLPLVLYLVVGIPHIRNRYAYILIPPVVLLLLRLLTSPTPPPIKRLQSVSQLGAKVVLGIVLLAWMPLFGAPFFSPGVMERELAASSYMEALDSLVADLPPGTIMDFENVPTKFAHRDNMKIWLDLNWSAKRIVVGTVEPGKDPRGIAQLSMTRSGNHAVISATYPFQPQDEGDFDTE